jgi:hypothetical protein
MSEYRPYRYVVWFRDLLLPSGDQDAKWPASIKIIATSAEEAAAWGNHLAASLCARREALALISASVVAIDQSASSSVETQYEPTVHVGDEATDDDIGW